MDIIENNLGEGLWKKLSSSINYYLRTGVDWELSNDKLVEDYIDYCLEYDESIKEYLYLDKKSLNLIIIDQETLERIKKAFIERVEKKRASQE